MKLSSRKAVVLLSGGIDSSTVLAIAVNKGFVPHAISFDYGQRHRNELTCSDNICKSMGIKEHTIIKIDLRQIGGSALTSDIDVPKDRTFVEIQSGIPSTYVPGRNTIFLSFGLAFAEVIGTGDIFIGVNSIDYSGYPDCRPEYIEAYERMANLATKTGVENKRITIHAPLIKMTKAEIIKKGIELGVDYSLTSSCYDPTPENKACGRCDSCIHRLKGFSIAGYQDPIEYGKRKLEEIC